MWSGKDEHSQWSIETVNLAVQERLSTQAIVSAVKRDERLLADLFDTPKLSPSKELEFYQHDVSWTIAWYWVIPCLS